MKKLSICIGVTIIVAVGVFLTSPTKGLTQDVEEDIVVLSEDEIKEIELEKKLQEEIKEREKERVGVASIFLEEAGEYKDNIALYYYNFDTDIDYAINETREFRAASTVKLPQAMMVCDDIHKGRISLDTMMRYNKETDFEGGTGSLQFRDNIGSISIGEALGLSIRNSDNIAYRMLKRYTSSSVTNYIHSITGISNTTHSRITAEQGMIILKRLYENPENNPNYDIIINHLKNTVFHETMDKYIPYNKVAHKIGSFYRYYHDYGIVYADTNYLLVILTKDVGDIPSWDTGEDNISLLDGGEIAMEKCANISKRIYELNLEIKADKIDVDA